MEELGIKIYTLEECDNQINSFTCQIEADKRMLKGETKRERIIKDSNLLDLWKSRKEYCETHRVSELAIYNGKILDHTKWDKIKELLKD